MKLKDIPEVLFDVRKCIVAAPSKREERLRFCEKLKQAEDLIESAMKELPYSKEIRL